MDRSAASRDEMDKEREGVDCGVELTGPTQNESKDAGENRQAGRWREHLQFRGEPFFLLFLAPHITNQALQRVRA